MKPRIADQSRNRYPIPGWRAEPVKREAVTLDRLLEYRMLLPGVVRYLRGERRKHGGMVNVVRYTRITSRLGEIATFQQQLNDIAYDETRSFALSPDETIAAGQYLDQVDEDTPQGELALRAGLARLIEKCTTTAKVVMNPENFASAQELWLNEDTTYDKNQNPDQTTNRV